MCFLKARDSQPSVEGILSLPGKDRQSARCQRTQANGLWALHVEENLEVKAKCARTHCISVHDGRQTGGPVLFLSEWLKTTEHYSPTVLEPRSPKSGCQQGWLLLVAGRENLCLSPSLWQLPAVFGLLRLAAASVHWCLHHHMEPSHGFFPCGSLTFFF